MSTEPTRSEQVIGGYKQHKLARSALQRIHDLIREFEKDDAFDRRAALVGVIGLVVLVVVALAFLFGATETTIG